MYSRDVADFFLKNRQSANRQIEICRLSANRQNRQKKVGKSAKIFLHKSETNLSCLAVTN